MSQSRGSMKGKDTTLLKRILKKYKNKPIPEAIALWIRIYYPEVTFAEDLIEDEFKFKNETSK